MLIKVGTTQLAGGTLETGVTGIVAEPSDVRVSRETTIQESKPIGGTRRRLYGRDNAGGTLSFTVRPRYASLAAAAEKAWSLAGLRGTTGVLDVRGTGGSSNAASGATADTSGRKAIVRRVETNQIGVTVEVHFEIDF